jgi:hypothetical protein
LIVVYWRSSSLIGCLVSHLTPPTFRWSRWSLVRHPPTAVFHFLLEATSSSHPN